MGMTVQLEDSDLRCKSRALAVEAARIVHANEWMHPYHFEVAAVCTSNPKSDANWFLDVEHFQGDHWNDDEARKLWLALTPYLADGATLEFQSMDGVRWRVRWEGGHVFEEYVTDVVWAVDYEITASIAKEESA